MDLLLFFALPVATIILAVVLQKILKCPILVAATFFAIFLIVAFAAFDATFLIFAIIYTLLAFITAVITKFICETFGRNGIFIRNINANNINTNTLSANEIINNDDDDDDNDNDNNNNNGGCNSCICNNRRYGQYNRCYYRR